MREKYESLALVDLKEIAKARGIKGTSGMKKAEIIEAMLLEDEKECAERDRGHKCGAGKSCERAKDPGKKKCGKRP